MTRRAPPSPASSLLEASTPRLALRRVKVGWFQARRLAAWTLSPTSWSPSRVAAGTTDFPFLLYACEIPLRRDDSAADPLLDDGKRHNVALAAPHFDGVELTADRPFSFWRNLGRITRSRGFRHGMELRGGCIVPALGGGICLLSNALFRMACELGWTIHERHGHTMEAAPPLEFAPIVCRGVTRDERASQPSPVPWGMDATVFWPHVDLRFAPRSGRARLDVTVVGDVLRIAAHGDAPMPDVAVTLESANDSIDAPESRKRPIDRQPGATAIRRNRVVRRIVCRSTGRSLAREIVAENRKRLLDRAGQRRNCLTCHQTRCHARPGETDQLIQLRSRMVRSSTP